MKIYVVGNKNFYPKIAEIVPQLENPGHKVTPPNGFDAPGDEAKMQKLNALEYQKWKADMIKTDGKIVKSNDAILVVNLDKPDQKNYIGGSTFLEMFKAFDLGKKIFLYNPIPNNSLEDEIRGFGPTVINGNLNLIE